LLNQTCKVWQSSVGSEWVTLASLEGLYRWLSRDAATGTKRFFG